MPNVVLTNENISFCQIKDDTSIFAKAKQKGKEIKIKVQTEDKKFVASWAFDGSDITSIANDVNLAVKVREE